VQQDHAQKIAVNNISGQFRKALQPSPLAGLQQQAVQMGSNLGTLQNQLAKSGTAFFSFTFDAGQSAYAVKSAAKEIEVDGNAAG
jgi:hypothetical protein